VVLSLSDFIFAIIHCLMNENKEPKIHINAHIAGALSGILLGFIFYESHRIDEEENEKKFKIVKWISIAIYLSFILVTIILNLLSLN
jgi:membrane associated rhomboid family serine protease